MVEQTIEINKESPESMENNNPSSKYKERKLTKFLKKLYSKPPLLIASMVVLVVAIALFFNRSIVINGFKKLLNSLGVYTEVVKNVEITSDNYGKPGSWYIYKSAEWTGPGKAQVTFDVNSVLKTDSDNYKDIILVLDISGSMYGGKLDRAISDSKELVNYLLSESNNRVALVTFDTDSSIISSFSNDKHDLLAKLSALRTAGCTNYNAALQNIDVVMNGYTKENNRDVVTLFLTDGYPNEDTPNQIGTYELLKDKYPYMTINGIQYEMGKDIIEEIKQITDNQWVADRSILNNVLFESTITPVIYENFVVSDFIENEYFYVNSVDDIIVTRGTASLEEENGVQKVVWNLDDNFSTGSSAQMYINIDLKDNYLGTSKFLPTNKKEEISYKIEGEPQKEVKSNKTPVLKHSFDVVYDTNTPTGCRLSAIPKESHYVYETVTKKSDTLSCPGYLFRGWEIIDADLGDITIINDDNFIMPEHDVTLRATWGRQTIAKSMNGTVYENKALYYVLQKEAESGGLAKEYTGAHQDSISSTGKEKIYHWYANDDSYKNGTVIQNKNNVIFAGFCWQMARTTDTGGVKMIYNGEPDANGKCGERREEHVGYTLSRWGTQNLASNYYYGTSYIYDSSTKMFRLDGAKTLATWNATTGPTLAGKYTCLSDNQNATCDTLYYVESYKDAKEAYVFLLVSTTDYSSIGKIIFSNVDSFFNPSPAFAGYMYNKVYIIDYEDILSTNYRYAKSFTYSNGTYKLSDGVTSISASTDMDISVFDNAHYTCFSNTDTCKTLSYIYSFDDFDGSVSYINLTDGESIEDALNNMLKADDVNKTNSTIKTAIDLWYEKNLTSYTKYLEDIVYCNNRGISDLGGWNPNGGSLVDNLKFKEFNVSTDLSCPNVTDRFSVQNSKAKLKYPVGLMTVSEMYVLNNLYGVNGSHEFWLASPYVFNDHVLFYSVFPATGGLIDANSDYFAISVRPTISLKADTMYSDGDGSMDHPYIVELD